MRFAIFLAMVFFTQRAFSREQFADPLTTVNARMAAYNKHDINAFLTLYSENIQIFTFPNIALGPKGKDHLESIFELCSKRAE